MTRQMLANSFAKPPKPSIIFGSMLLLQRVVGDLDRGSRLRPRAIADALLLLAIRLTRNLAILAYFILLASAAATLSTNMTIFAITIVLLMPFLLPRPVSAVSTAEPRFPEPRSWR